MPKGGFERQIPPPQLLHSAEIATIATPNNKRNESGTVCVWCDRNTVRETIDSQLVSCLVPRVHEPSKVYSKAEGGHAGHLEVVIHVCVDA